MSLLRIEQDLETRLATYERALELLEDFYSTGKYLPYSPKGESLGLCLLLPCILWDLHSYLSDDPDDKSWDYEDTQIAFPELSNYLDAISDAQGNTEKNNCRLECLKKMIEEVKLEMEGKYVSE